MKVLWTAVLLLVLGRPGDRSSVGVVAIECKFKPDKGKCEVPSCGTANSPEEKDLWIPNGECQEAAGYRELETEKRSACIERYLKVFDPARKALRRETFCTVAGDIFLEGLDLVNPLGKAKWIAKGNKKVKDTIKYLDDKIQNKFESLLDKADKKVKEILNKMSEKGGELYEKSKDEIKSIKKYYEELKDAAFEGDSKYKKELKKYCDEQLPSENVGNIEENVGFLCEDLVDKVAGEIKKTVKNGYVELYKAIVEDVDNYEGELKKFSDGLKKKSLDYLIQKQNEYENEILLVNDISDGIKNFKANQRKKLIKACSQDYQLEVDAIAEACFEICNVDTVEEVLAEGEFEGDALVCFVCEDIEDEDQKLACRECMNKPQGLWEVNAGKCWTYLQNRLECDAPDNIELVTLSEDFGELCPCLNVFDCGLQLLAEISVDPPGLYCNARTC